MKKMKKSSDGKPVLVIGGGISGLQSALNLAQIGVKVILVERSPALGGALPLLFRTYPECACCRIYQKMLEVESHPNIEVFTLSEVVCVEKKENNFNVTILNKPRYIDTSMCIACDRCAEVCPQTVSISGGFGWGERKAAYLLYPQAVPFAYAIDGMNCLYLKEGTCKECEKICPTEAIRLDETEKTTELEVSKIIVASGFDLPDVSILNKYGYQLPNVLTAVEFERLMSISGPTKGKILCPGSGNPPEKVAWIQCVGSRDVKNPDSSHCSSVCCMFAIKEALNAKELLGDSVETDIYFMDVRAFGKHFEEYAIAAQEKGVNFKYTRIHSVVPKADSDRLEVFFHNHENDLVEKSEYDLVILSTGLKVSKSTRELLEKLGVELTGSSFAKTDSFDSVRTSVPGVYVCGSLSGPKDIYDSMVEAGAVAAEIAGDLPLQEGLESSEPSEVSPGDERIGVFICNCPIYKIADDQVLGLTEKIKSLPGVAEVEIIKNLCTAPGKRAILEKIKKSGINKVVLTGCALSLRRDGFEEVFSKEGLQPDMLEMIDLSEHVSDVTDGIRTINVFSLSKAINETIAKASSELLPVKRVSVVQAALVVGGGVSGMEYALAVADQGYKVYLVEKSSELGGSARDYEKTWQGEPVKPYVDGLIKRIREHSNIEVYLDSEVIRNDGFRGNYRSVILNRKSGDEKEVDHGVIHLAPGGKELKPVGYYCYGDDPRVVTLGEFQKELSEREEIAKAQAVVFIQCVGSREKDRPYCSRVCCTSAIINAIDLKKINPNMKVIVFHRDIRTYGLKEELYREALGAGVFFVRYDKSSPPVVEPRGEKLEVKGSDSILGKELIIEADRVVLAAATVADNAEISRVFSVDLDENGFFAESHEKMKPVEFSDETITMSGNAHAPKFLDESIAQARAAAVRSLALLRKGFVEGGRIIATVEIGKCAVCCTCVRVCPFGVPQIVGGVSFIDENLCKGCGACVAECPGKAISLVYYEEEALLDKYRACFS